MSTSTSVVICCPFSSYGCSSRFLPSDLSSHISSNVALHVRLVESKFRALSSAAEHDREVHEATRMRCNELESEVEAVRLENRRLHKRVAKLQSQNQNQNQSQAVDSAYSTGQKEVILGQQEKISELEAALNDARLEMKAMSERLQQFQHVDLHASMAEMDSHRKAIKHSKHSPVDIFRMFHTGRNGSSSGQTAAANAQRSESEEDRASTGSSFAEPGELAHHTAIHSTDHHDQHQFEGVPSDVSDSDSGLKSLLPPGSKFCPATYLTAIRPIYRKVLGFGKWQNESTEGQQSTHTEE